MMTGEVSPYREAILRIQVRGAEGREIEVEAVLDTGFTEFLTLSPEIVSQLELTYSDTSRAVLADGSLIALHVYEGIVLWNDVEYPIPIHATEGAPLIGMSLLDGYLFMIQVVDGGHVTIEPLLMSS